MFSNRETQTFARLSYGFLSESVSLFSRGDFIALSERDDWIVPVEIPTP